MKTFFKQKEVLCQFAIWGLLIVWYFLFGNQMLHKADQALDDIIKSHSFWMFSREPQEKDIITIVAIDQESRQHLNLKWPWPRSTTAEMIGKISAYSPKAIGLDIVFSGESQPAEDQALIDALKSHPQIIAASVVQADGIIKPAPKFETALKSIGFVNRPTEGGKVRSLIPIIQDANQPQLIPMEFEILQAYLGTDITKRLKLSKDELRLGEQMKIKLKNGLIPLNYLVYHKNFRIVPAHKVFKNQIDPLDFKNKIVLIGATDPIIHDEYDTVLGIFPGVAIIANALVMLLSQRFLTELPLYQILLIGLICSAIIYLICRRSGLLVSTLTLIVLMAATFLSCLYLRSHDIRISALTLLFMQFVTFLSFNLYHYISLVYIRNKIMNRTLYDPGSGLYTTRYFKLLTQEKCEKTSALALVGIKIANYERLTRRFTIDQIGELIKEFTASLRDNGFLSKKDAMASVSPGVIGIIKENQKFDEVAKELEDFITGSEKKEWILDDRRVRVSLKGLLLQKAAGERIPNCDPVSQMNQSLSKLNDTQSVYCEAIHPIEINTDKSKIDVRNEYDFIVLDWEEKAKDLAKSMKALSAANSRLNRLNIGIVKTLARSIDAKSAWTAGHSERVTRTAVKLGKIMGIDNRTLKRLKIGGLLHDIGKIGIPGRILDKPGKLTDEEYAQICEHPAKGARIMEPLEQLRNVIALIHQHHERFDGKGYPQGLVGDDIDPGARIIAVADVYDALRSDRPYRSGMPLEKVVAIIEEGSGTQFDPEVVTAFLQFIAAKLKSQPTSSEDRLTIQPSHILDKPAASTTAST